MKVIKKSPLSYIHFRDHGSTAICGRTGQHTTRKEGKVTCLFCLDKIKKEKARKPEQGGQ